MYEQFDLLEVLHPTPAVCGHPQAPAREAITASGMIFLPHSTTDPEKIQGFPGRLMEPYILAGFKIARTDWNLLFLILQSPSTGDCMRVQLDGLEAQGRSLQLVSGHHLFSLLRKMKIAGQMASLRSVTITSNSMQGVPQVLQ